MIDKQREEELKNKSIDDLSIDEIYELEDMYSPLVSSEQKKDKISNNNPSLNFTNQELSDLIQ